jgi:hypothetical protein
MTTGPWTARSVVQIVGWGLVFLAVVLVFGGFVGEAGGASHEPGSDTMRGLIFDRSLGHAALVMVAVGVVTLLASLLLRREDT